MKTVSYHAYCLKTPVASNTHVREAADCGLLCAEDLGFNRGRPVAALLIFRSCLQWKVFQLNQTQLFDRIINTMGGQIEAKQDNNTCLSYWLSNTVTLLYLLQKNIKPASGGTYNSRLRSPASRSAYTPDHLVRAGHVIDGHVLSPSAALQFLQRPRGICLS